MRLCTFELKTPLGRHQRLGAAVPEGVIDLHSACAWRLFERGEARPYRLAQALVPPSMLDFLQGGASSMAAARDAVAALTASRDAGAAGTAHPEGPNGETLIFRAADVALKAPLPHPSSMRDFYAFEQHVKKGFEKRGEPMPPEWYEIPVYYK